MKEFLIYCPHCNKATRATELHAGDRLCAICGKTFTILTLQFLGFINAAKAIHVILKVEETK